MALYKYVYYCYIITEEMRTRRILSDSPGAAPSATKFSVSDCVIIRHVSIMRIIVKKLNSLKHLVRTTVAESHN